MVLELTKVEFELLKKHNKKYKITQNYDKYRKIYFSECTETGEIIVINIR